MWWAVGIDFTNDSITLTIPAAEVMDGTQVFQIPEFFDIIDDIIDEDAQSFALVAEIGDDVPFNCYMEGIGLTDCSCFQIQEGETDCFGRRGATTIRITDDDSKKSHCVWL